jgi:hypothetical protein
MKTKLVQAKVTQTIHPSVAIKTKKREKKNNQREKKNFTPKIKG